MSTPDEPGPSRPTSHTIQVERPSKRLRRSKESHQQMDSDPVIDAMSTTNPYTLAVRQPARPDRGASPHYAPASPNPQSTALDPVQDPLLYDNIDRAQAEPQSNGRFPAPPNAGLCDVGGISEDDATSYAMASQYWAGYWMGVAQSKKQNQQAQPLGDQGQTVALTPSANHQVVITRRDFGNKARSGFRR